MSTPGQSQGCDTLAPFSPIPLTTQSQGISSDSMSLYLGVDCPSPLPVYLGQHPPALRFAAPSEPQPRLGRHVSADFSLRCMCMHAIISALDRHAHAGNENAFIKAYREH